MAIPVVCCSGKPLFIGGTFERQLLSGKDSGIALGMSVWSYKKKGRHPVLS
jgi:hypothetical protein